MIELHRLLSTALNKNQLPTVLAYNRIDGPGSSLDLREFQQSLWSLPELPKDIRSDPSMEWSATLPRTIGMTINTGTKIYAEPFDKELISVKSIEYGTDVFAKPGEVLPIKENWLLKIMELFGLKGVKFILHNLRPGIQSSGLGGSATATTGVCILANQLAGKPLDQIQLVSMASRIEQDFGISLTGTQEQSNVMFGGVTDYIWFPWGIPTVINSSFGSSIRTEILPPNQYAELECRFAIFHTGIVRSSTDVNDVWKKKLYQAEGYKLHNQKINIAYRFREGLRLKRWDSVLEAIKEYQRVRTLLCASYMDGALEIQGFALEHGGVTFPLGAGGGGGVLIFAPDPQSLLKIKQELSSVYREIPFQIKETGHQLINLPLNEELT